MVRPLSGISRAVEANPVETVLRDPYVMKTGLPRGWIPDPESASLTKISSRLCYDASFERRLAVSYSVQTLDGIFPHFFNRLWKSSLWDFRCQVPCGHVFEISFNNSLILKSFRPGFNLSE